MGIGHTPNTKFLNGQINTDDHGFIITEGTHPDTNIPGVFACGDVQDSYYRQAISAAGTGCMAAIRAEKFLEE
jgi:thioredoxin reductase (NADPH)